MTDQPYDPDHQAARDRFLRSFKPATEPADTEPSEWEEPVPLGHEGHYIPFPGHRLPPWLAMFVEECSRDLQVPIDLPGCLVLAALATAVGGRAVVEVKQGWREPTNLYVAVALPPGERKTPSFARVVQPLYMAEAQAIEAIKADVAEAVVQRSVLKEKADKAMNDAAKASEASMAEAMNFAKAQALLAESIEVPVLPRLIADDATPEALASLIALHGGRMALFSDEGGVFDMMAGRYSTSGPNLDVYLKGHSGSPLRVDRKNRDAEIVNHPALTVGLTIQPDVLTHIQDIPGARGRGLIGRFLWSMPISEIGTRVINPEPMSERTEAVYDAEMRLIVNSLASWTDPAVLVLTDDARQAVFRFMAHLEPRLVGDLDHMRDWAAKLAGHMVRIAGLLHVATNIRVAWNSPIEVETMNDAIHIADYFLHHGKLAYGWMASDRLLRIAQAVLPWIGERDRFRQRDLHRNHAYRFKDAAEVADVLALLVDHGFLREAPKPPTTRRGGRPPSPLFWTNPRIRNPEP